MIGFVVGAWVGLALYAALRLATPRAPDYLQLQRQLYTPAPTVTTRHRLGAVLVRTDLGRRLVTARADDLAILELPADQAVLRVASAAAIGFLAPLAVSELAQLAGVRLGGLTTMAAAAAGLGLGILFSLRNLVAAAEARRQAYHQALAAYLDLVRVTVGSGIGPDQALTAAAGSGHGPCFDALDAALATRGSTPAAQAVADAGRRLAYPPLQELGGKLVAAGQGAQLMSTIESMSDSLRDTVLTDIEARAQAANIRMTLPIVVLASGVILWLAYPAVAALVATL